MDDPSNLNDYSEFIFSAYIITLFSLLVLFGYILIRLKAVNNLIKKHQIERKN